MPTFQYVAPTDEQKELMQKFRDNYEALAKEIAEELTTSSRAISLALTKLEESSMWLNKAITKND